MQRRRVARHRARHLARAGGASLRLPVPGLRALPPPERMAERRLRDAPRPGAASGAGRPRSCWSASGSPRPPMRGRRPCRGASASAWRSRARWRASRCALLLDEPLAALDATTSAAAARELGAALRDAGVPALLVTHDFAHAAQLGEEVAVIDRGRVVQRGRAAELAAAPASAFVADFAGASVLAGDARRRAGRAHARRRSTAAASVVSTDRAEGRTGASVFPWEVTIEAAGRAAPRLGPELADGHGRLGDAARQPRARRALDAPAARGGGDRIGRPPAVAAGGWRVCRRGGRRPRRA